jgi:hypothetical protein
VTYPSQNPHQFQAITTPPGVVLKQKNSGWKYLLKVKAKSYNRENIVLLLHV